MTNHTPKKLKEVMTEEELNWRSIADEGAIVRTWNFPPTPAFYVIDHKAVIRHKWVGNPGHEAIDAALARLIQSAEKVIKCEQCRQSD